MYTSVPANLPCQLAPEWAAQSAVLLTWPHSNTDWRDSLPQVEPAFAAMASTISHYQAVLIICQDAQQQSHIQQQLQQQSSTMANVYYCHLPSNDTWTRDFGPLSVCQAQQALALDFQFNAWGDRYASDLDNAINQQLKQQGLLQPPLHSVDFVLEGGSIDTDGCGSLLTTRACLLNKSRHHSEQTQVEAMLREQLGVERILWLNNGSLQGDDTDSHIDNLARFTDSNTIVYASCNDPQDPHYIPLQAMAEELARFTTLAGEPYQLQPLPIPTAQRSQYDQRRLPASYVNFLIINGAVLIPAFADPADRIAEQTLQACFPGRAIIPIDSRPFIEQNGGIHCLSMQLAAGIFNPDKAIAALTE